MNSEHHQQNRRSWNYITAVHNAHKLDQAAHLAGGGSTLFPEELELLGDVAGKRIVHLQCNSGQDTLSLAVLGATLTGVDISDEAIAFARQLAADSGIAADFVRDDVFDWLPQAAARGEQFDIVFSSYGALCWLSDLVLWAKGVKSVLAPGGALVLVDFHPLFNYLDDDWSLARKASGRAPVFYPEGVGDYVGMSGELLAVSGYIEVDAPPNPHGVWEYGWNLADIVTSVLEAGLQLTALREYPYTNGCLLLPGMQLKPDKRLYPPADLPQDLPLLFGLRATLAG